MRRRYRLTYSLDLIHQPIIYRMIKRFDVVTTILQAQVGADVGWLVLEIEGGEVVIAEATQWLVELGIRVEEVDKE